MKIHYQSVFDKWDIEDRAVQAIITSPPYYSLRKYSIPDVVVGGDNKDCKHEFKEIRTPAPNTQGGHSGKSKIQSGNIGGFATDYKDRAFYSNFCIHCHAWKGQHGLEPDYKLFISHCKLWMQEAIRVSRDDGVIFIALADSYSGSNCGSNDYTSFNRCKPESYQKIYKGQKTGKQDVKPKSKLLIPERFAIMCVDELGLILRNHIVWYKPNGMPESCQDRFSKKWESIFMLTKQEKYYFDLDGVKNPLNQATINRANYTWNFGKKSKSEGYVVHGVYSRDAKTMNEETAQKIREGNYQGVNPGDCWSIPTQPSPLKHFSMWPEKLVERMILCSTKAGDIVLDPFCGSGTTLRVADRLNRIGFGLELGYREIQEKRLSEIQKELILA